MQMIQMVKVSLADIIINCVQNFTTALTNKYTAMNATITA